MKRTIIVADDFLAEPEVVRQMALNGGFAPQSYRGEIFQGIALTPQDFLVRELSEVAGFTIRSQLSFFRLNRQRDKPSTYIHADDGEAEFAGVLYLTLSPLCRGGTAFWRHNQLGIETVPDEEKAPSHYETLRLDGLTESKWTMTGLIGMRFNRFVTYPTAWFHSRYPEQPWGQEATDSRLIWAVFYDRA